MNYDFILGNLAEKEAPTSPIEPLLETKHTNTPTSIKSRLERLTEATEQAPQLAKLYTAEQADHIRSLNMYRDYQNNIRAAGQLRTDILKGVKAAEPATALLLKACNCISNMTGDKLFYEQIEADLIAIYGLGLGEQEPIERELAAVRERLAKLQEAEVREPEPQHKARIATAVKEHKAREAYLQGLI